MPVTVRNYLFPIIFTYRGWMVTIYDASSFFQFSDVKVEVNISVDRISYHAIVQKAFQWRQTLQQRQNYPRYGFGLGAQNIAEKERLNKAIDDFLDTKKTIKYIEKANGGIIDRFFGQNISAIDKIQQNVKSYIDSNLGTADFMQELSEYLKDRGF